IAIMADGRVVREGTPEDIVLNPNNDYVAAFTRDVDRARLFDASSVMNACRPLKLDTASWATSDDASFVVDDNGLLAGVVAAKDFSRIGQGTSVKSLMTQDFETVRSTAKLLDIASVYRKD